MLIEFNVTNFLSFKEKTTLSAVASKDTSLPKNIIRLPKKFGFDLLRVLAIYGANASGKTNLIKAYQYMAKRIRNPSEDQSPDHSYFKLAGNSKLSEFEIHFISDDIRYQYGFALDKQKIHQEWFYSYPKRQKRVLFERDITNDVEYYFGPSWRGEKERLTSMTKPNHLFVRVAEQFNNDMASVVVKFLTSSMTYSASPKKRPYEVLTSFFAENSKSNILKYIRLADPTINDIVIETKDFDIDDERLMKKTGLDDSVYNELKPFLKSKVNVLRKTTEGNDVFWNLKHESDGTKKIFYLASLLETLCESEVVVLIDELDIHFHPLVTYSLIELVNKSNSKGQLIFTTHDSHLLDTELLRRDQIWFTEKNPNGATELYSLWDYRPRKNESLRKGYLSGRYGAIPFLGSLEIGACGVK